MVEVYLTTTIDNTLSHVFYDNWQSIGANVWMCFKENFILRTMLMEYFENTLCITAFFGACVEFSVRKSTCAAFAKAVIRFYV